MPKPTENLKMKSFESSEIEIRGYPNANFIHQCKKFKN